MGCPPDQLAVEDLQLEFCRSFADNCQSGMGLVSQKIDLLQFMADLAADCMLCGSFEEHLFSSTTSRSERVEIAAKFFDSRRIKQNHDFQEELDSAELQRLGAKSAYMRMRIRRLLERNFAATMDAPDELAALGFKTVIDHEIRETFLFSEHLPVRLVRFRESLVGPLIDSCSSIMSYDISVFKEHARTVFQHCILESFRDPYDPEVDPCDAFGTLYCDIRLALTEVVFEHLLVPCFVGKVPPFVRNAFSKVLEVPPEDCSEQRSVFKQRLATIDEIIAELQSIDDAPPGEEDDAVEALRECAAAAQPDVVRRSRFLPMGSESMKHNERILPSFASRDKKFERTPKARNSSAGPK
jgi:hypothetical protein